MREGAHDLVAALSAWEAEARAVEWVEPFDRVTDGDLGPDVRWFPGGVLNVAASCVDRHAAAHGDRVALHFEGEPGDRATLTYGELTAQVDRFAAALAELGVGPGSRVALYLGMIPELVVAMLACARLGAVHTVLFSALPAEALGDRLADFRPTVLVTQDGAWRHGVLLPLKARADEALTGLAGVQHTVVVRRSGLDVAWYEGDRWFHDLVARRTPAPPTAPVPADHPLLVVYLGSRRGRPLGFVHRSAGLLVHSLALHRALSGSPEDVYWCAVDIGWLAGQTHGVYGPLAAGATTVLYEGTLDTPTHDRAWQIIERYRVNALVTTPSVVRNLHGWVESPPTADRLRSLRHIVTAGEAIEPEVLDWLDREVGRARSIIRDGWGQTELGAIVAVEPQPDPPLPDPDLDVVDEAGRSVPPGGVGELVLRAPWPGQFCSIHGEGDRTRTTRYWAYPGRYATGDLARRSGDGELELLGRKDPVIQVLGQLVSADEVRAALQEHPFVTFAEVFGRPDDRHGHAVVACVRVGEEAEGMERGVLAAELRSHVEETLGGLARPRTVAFLAEIPDDVDAVVLRRALILLCRGRTDVSLVLDGRELRAAIAAIGGSGSETGG